MKDAFLELSPTHICRIYSRNCCSYFFITDVGKSLKKKDISRFESQAKIQTLIFYVILQQNTNPCDIISYYMTINKSCKLQCIYA